MYILNIAAAQTLQVQGTFYNRPDIYMNVFIELAFACTIASTEMNEQQLNSCIEFDAQP